MGVAKPQIDQCESCQRALALVVQVMPDRTRFRLCQSCYAPVVGARTYVVTPGRV